MPTLKHFGVLGMKWGVRKDEEIKDQATRLLADKKTLSKMTNAELQTLITRMNLEKQLYSMSTISTSLLGQICSKILDRIGNRLLGNIVDPNVDKFTNMIFGKNRTIDDRLKDILEKLRTD